MESSAYSHLTPAPPSLEPAVGTVLAARGQAEKLRAVIDQSQVPMVLVDNRRRYLEVNPPARLLYRRNLAELRASRVDNLVPPDGLPEMVEAWERMLAAGSVTGTRELPGPVGERLQIVFYGLANALPGLHLVALAPAGWSEAELAAERDKSVGLPLTGQLTPREQEVLQLAAEGLSTFAIAERLTLSPSTVTTHLAHIYEKLDVPGRTAAVAKGLRLGIIV
jgi:DNA-binding CsgD family transcriptional regulator